MKKETIERYHIIKDGTIIASVETRDEAVEKIEMYRSREKHWLKSEYWLIRGTEEFIRN